MLVAGDDSFTVAWALARRPTGATTHVSRGWETDERKTLRHVHKLDVQMVCVLKEWVRIWFERSGNMTLKESDCCVPPGRCGAANSNLPDDHEVLQITSLGDFKTVDAPAG